MRHLLALLLVFSCLPSWAMYKCVGAGGTVAFQEQPCDRTQAQTAIKPLVAAPRMESTALSGQDLAATNRPTLQQQNQQYEKERLKHDAEYALQSRTARLEQHRQRCDAEQREILANRARANNNLAGAMYEQSIATEAAAAATRCDTRGRDLQAEVEEARRQCAARGCM
jgi:hypothetical protein